MSRKPINSLKGYSPEVRIVLRVVKQGSVPEATRRLIDKLKHFQDKPFVLKSLNSLITPHRDMQRRARVKAFRILTVLITYMDWATFRIGVPKAEFNDPVKHRAMIKRYVKMYDEVMPESTWFSYIDKLTQAGYLNSANMNIRNQEGQIRGTAGLKWLTMKFMKELNLKLGWLDEQRNHALERLKKSGRCNVWPTYASKLAKKKRARAISEERTQTNSVLSQFDTVLHSLDDSPPLLQ
ncbi:TPA: hypothetical protein ACPVW6_000182 [Vibrio parahaemolyticus]|uniref:hypothetical protein n=1 Tax=Vibrio parahaemolyticus TaxID=670 RepID=UPI0007A0C8B8|nr:hypothetical protein [Vibrio parahaemolyticus]EJG0411456.1 hypothetical protein [Vibrio parahaemolyticus]EKC5520337.1 hypothetical protein [Vibrio parahaemolyticus]KYY37574.1 hypothetical protein AWQ12_07935 [Vibrio parahaemolyticus]MCX8880280.1 hypothetical protein [Vibrio parahaemolyticus]HCE5298101.1 hypothetical protein [Vibrio parahaemolyticus]